MKHLGDITQIKGSEVPIVDIVTGGSPCQDLSVAGKRAGLAGERSGLFMEQIRIIKEMREHDRNTRAVVDIRLLKPRFMVWENVPGAFSSNKGEDFRAVLEETARVAEKDAVIPRPENGKWTPSGCIMGDGWSIAWRVHDAQFWGVPQRRKRIALVADFGGQTAPEILFERKGLSGNIAQGGKEGEDAATDVRPGIEETGRCLNRWDVQSKHIQPENGIAESLYAGECRGGGGESYVMQSISFQERAGKPGGGKGILIQNERTGALSTLNNQSVVYGICSDGSNSMRSNNPHSGIYEADTSRTLDLNGGNPGCNQGGMAVVQSAGVDTYNQTIDEELAQPLRAADGGDSTPKVVCIGVKVSEDGMVQTLSGRMGTGGNNVPMVMEEPLSIGHDIRSARFTDDGIIDPLTATDYKDPIKILDNKKTYQDITGTLGCDITKGTNNQLANSDMFVANTSVVRRLTPMECERLQGYPDGWTDIGDWIDSKGKKHKGEADSPRYKALGNSIALPFWQWMAERMVKYIDHEATMGSLFDGIGGFPLVYSRVGCQPIWASEIEEFPIAVTKLRFPEKENNDPKEGEIK